MSFHGDFFLTLYISLIMVLIKSQIPWIICSFSYCSSKLTGFSILVIFIHNLLVNYISTVYLHSARVQFKQLIMHIKGAHRICSSSTVKMLLTVPRTKNKINVIFGQSAIEYINKEDFKARFE